jgi:hypothetical protein
LDEDPPSNSDPIPEQDEVDDEEFVTHLDPSTTDPPLDDPGNLDPPSAPLPTHPNPTQPTKSSLPFCEIIQPKLRALLLSLFSQLPTPLVNGRFFSPLLRYVVLASFGTDGKWSDDTTQDLAALLFTGRLTFYSEMRAGLPGVREYETYHSSVL